MLVPLLNSVFGCGFARFPNVLFDSVEEFLADVHEAWFAAGKDRVP